MNSFNPETPEAREIEYLTLLCSNGQYERYFNALKEYAQTPVGERLMLCADRIIPQMRNNLKKIIIATLDPDRRPRDGEIIICYGDYPLGFDGLICNNPVFRHLKYFWSLEHDVVEYDSVWEPIEKIYIINLDEYADRYMETLRELKRMDAPFHRIERFSALRDRSTDDPLLNGYIGCNRSHLAVIEDICNQGYENSLILEDDFCFVDGIRQNHDSLRLFFHQRNAYHVCMLAVSNAEGIEPYNDLLSRVNLRGTTTSGYIVSREGALRLRDIWGDALTRLPTTRDIQYLADQAWAVLQPEGKFFVFKRKMGFQRPCVSCITKKMVFDLD